jgi:hypothetical protein
MIILYLKKTIPAVILLYIISIQSKSPRIAIVCIIITSFSFVAYSYPTVNTGKVRYIT